MTAGRWHKDADRLKNSIGLIKEVSGQPFNFSVSETDAKYVFRLTNESLI